MGNGQWAGRSFQVPVAVVEQGRQTKFRREKEVTELTLGIYGLEAGGGVRATNVGFSVLS